MAAFGMACVVLIAVPGPSVLFIVGRALEAGQRTALTTVVGNALGTYTVAVIVSVGFGPVLQRFPACLTVLKFVGAAFLCWLGLVAIKNRKNVVVGVPGQPGQRRRDWAALRQGYVVGGTNPKAYVVFAVILPAFLRPDIEPLVAQMLILAVVPVVIGLLCDSVWAAFSSAARKWFARSAARMHRMSLLGGALMIGLGLTMAFT
ncbi:putative translocator [Amorphoplanes auranticolor]|uniref:Translocator n=2 Tax=Actinoplanes auranticolor TaxID=47988 RepID=A0A919S7I4_9ACTN|nr:putative translocator [Actinoplanes auranticolor]